MRFVTRSLCGLICVAVVTTGCATGEDDPAAVTDQPSIAAPSEPTTPPTEPSTEPSIARPSSPTTSTESNESTDDTVSTTSAHPNDDLAPAGTPSGFDSVAATITTASGEVCELCLWVADDPALRSRGLMDVTDLGSADGMLFSYGAPTSTAFWMKDTPLPLSIVFFDGQGMYLDSFDMEPCVAEPCEHYPTPLDFIDAIEFPQGSVDELGVGPGSLLVVDDLPCVP